MQVSCLRCDIAHAVLLIAYLFVCLSECSPSPATPLLWRLKHRSHRGNVSCATQQMLRASGVCREEPLHPKSQILRTFLV